MSVHGVLIVVLVALLVMYVGFRIGEREGDSRGIIGFGLGLLTLVAGITYLLGV